MSCDVGEVTERLENELCYDYNYELCSFSNLSVTSPRWQLILQPFRRFTYVTAHSPTLPLLHVRHSSFSNPSFASPASHALHLMTSAHSPTFPPLHLRSQLILQPFHRFTYVTAHSPTLPLLHLRHSSFSNPSFASPASHVLHLGPNSPGEPPVLQEHENITHLAQIYFNIIFPSASRPP